MQIQLDLNSISDYQLFLRIKSLPTYSFQGRVATFPDEYASFVDAKTATSVSHARYKSLDGLWDYQSDISGIAIDKQKFACFIDCGLGKTLVMLEFARHVRDVLGISRRVLIVSPLMVVAQTMAEAKRFYGDSLPIVQVRAGGLDDWIQSSGDEIGITNYEALRDTTPQGRLGALILDESGMLASHYGKHGQQCIRLGAGLDWKLCLTGTPAPNDRIEFANHAVFLDAFPTINSFLAKFFINRGQTQDRWEIKPHAIGPFFRALSHWSIFMTNPATYGWKDNCENIPPINIHVHDVDMTDEQKELVWSKTGTLFACDIGGISKRSTLGQIAKGNYKGKKIATNKTRFIRENLVDTWPNESTIIWCLYDAEQESMNKMFPGAVTITGTTPFNKRVGMVEDFQSGHKKVLISKPKILGLGLNMQIATRMVFSGLQDSYMQFYQGIKRANRYGSTRDLNVHLPVTDVEMPMVETVLKKAKRIQEDMDVQERLFKEQSFYGRSDL